MVFLSSPSIGWLSLSLPNLGMSFSLITFRIRYKNHVTVRIRYKYYVAVRKTTFCPPLPLQKEQKSEPTRSCLGRTDFFVVYQNFMACQVSLHYCTCFYRNKTTCTCGILVSSSCIHSFLKVAGHMALLFRGRKQADSSDQRVLLLLNNRSLDDRTRLCLCTQLLRCKSVTLPQNEKKRT